MIASEETHVKSSCEERAGGMRTLSDGIGLRAISRRSLERKKAHRVGHEYTPLVANEVVQGHLPMGGREGEVGQLVAELESGGRCRAAHHALCTYAGSTSPHCPRQSRRGPGKAVGPSARREEGQQKESAQEAAGWARPLLRWEGWQQKRTGGGR